MKTKFICLFLCCILTFSFGFVGCGEKKEETLNSVSETVTLTPLSADGDKLLWNNPDRGFRTQFMIMLKKTQGDEPRAKRTVYVDESEEQIRRDIQSIFDIYNPKSSEQTKLSLAYIYITDWRGEELSEDLLRFFDIYFEMCRERKWKNMLRIAYCDSHAEIQRGADEQTIIRHIKQISGTIAENADVIHTIEAGWVGAYGEWAEVYQYPEVDYVKVIKAIVENLAVPNNLYFSLSAPPKSKVEKDYEYYWAIGHNDDSMFGYHNRGWKPSAEYGTENWLMVEKEAAYAPGGGEMHTNLTVMTNNTVPIGWEMLMQCYYWRRTTLSYWQGYREAIGQDNTMTRWMSEELTPEMLDKQGIIYDPTWFLDDNGKEIRRNPFEFIRDHLGYKLVAQDADISWSGNSSEKMQVNMSLINYGFSAAFNLESGFAILDSEGSVVSEVTAGEPNKWYNRDPDDAYSKELLSHNVSAELEAPTKKGEYKLAFFLRNTLGVYANLSNKCENVNGYNVLCSFEV